MGSLPRTAQELLEQGKYDPLVALLVDRLGVDEAVALWVRAERHLGGLLAQSEALPRLERVLYA